VAKVSSGKTSERFGFIDRYRSELGTQFLCEWLSVSRSGFYAWKKRKPSKRIKSDNALLNRIKSIFDKSKGRFGSPRVYEDLKQQGILVGRLRVERLMKLAGLKGRVTRVTRRVPGLKRFVAKGEDRLLVHGNATRINQVWVADITYINHQGSWQYLVTVMDQYSRRILGWTISKSRTADITARVLAAAIKNRAYPRGIIFHTDRGVEFTGSEFQRILH
jgi:putative transposase